MLVTACVRVELCGNNDHLAPCDLDETLAIAFLEQGCQSIGLPTDPRSPAAFRYHLDPLSHHPR